MDSHIEKAHEVLESLLGEEHVLVAVKSNDGRYRYANPAFAQWLGRSAFAVVGRTDEELLPEATAHGLRDADREAVATGHPVLREHAFEVVGARRFCAATHYVLRSEQRGVLGTGFIAIDITGIAATRDEMATTLQELRSSNLHLQQSLSALQAQASTDALTGAWNRSRFEEAARSEMARLQRYRHPVSLVFFDLDHFKQVNDTYGHAVGDRVLVQVVAAARTACRATDAIARWGGEEFVVLTPNTALEGASALAERLRQAIASLRIPPLESVSASLGVADCGPSDTLETWLGRADEAAYRAKRGGRNRVEVAAPADGGPGGADRVAASFVQMVWHAAYDSGNPTIDAQHQALFRHANALLVAVLDSRPADEVNAAIDALVDEVVRHFDDEERILRGTRFPGVDEHAEIHAGLVAQAVEHVQAFREHRAGVGALFQFLAHEVIARHMLKEDRRFFPYLT